jgi:hypothetical protein
MTSPIEKSIYVTIPQAKAFELFTAKMATWWPFSDAHAIFEARHASFVFEGRVGGHVKEVSVDGKDGMWGTITSWNPPSKFTMTWHPGRGPETAQELEVSFVPEGDGTRVTLLHRGWEKLGDEATKMHAGYTRGWDFVFVEKFGSAAAAVSRFNE